MITRVINHPLSAFSIYYDALSIKLTCLTVFFCTISVQVLFGLHLHFILHKFLHPITYMANVTHMCIQKYLINSDLLLHIKSRWRISVIPLWRFKYQLYVQKKVFSYWEGGFASKPLSTLCWGHSPKPQILGALLFKLLDQGLCKWTPLGNSPISAVYTAIPATPPSPNVRCVDESVVHTCHIRCWRPGCQTSLQSPRYDTWTNRRRQSLRTCVCLKSKLAAWLTNP